LRRNLERISRDFDRAWPSSFFRTPTFFGRSSALPIETYDQDKRLLKIEVDLPNFNPEEIQVTVKSGQVEIAAKSDTSKGDFKESRELNYRYSIPADADIDKVRSILTADGRLVLEVPSPPKLEASKPKQDQEIPIKKA